MNKNSNLLTPNSTGNIIGSFEVGGFDYAEPLTPQQVSKNFSMAKFHTPPYSVWQKQASFLFIK